MRLTLVIVPLLLVCGAVHADPFHNPFAPEPGRDILFVEANSKAGFHHPYFLSIPKSTLCVHKPVLVVETNNTGKVDDDPDLHTEAARSAITGRSLGPYVAQELGLPLLVPAFPRPEVNSEIYTHALDRDTMKVDRGPLERIDLQLLRMIDDARERLKQRNVETNSRVFMTGFSASGTFSNRFAFLHPNALLGVASGAVNGIPMLPVRSLNGHALNYPLGLKDFRKISRLRFDADTWRELPQFIFMGADDDNDAVKYDDAYSDKERETVYAAIGRKMQPDRWLNAQRAYRNEDSAATFTTYGATAHWTDKRINDDVTNFFRALLRKQTTVADCMVTQPTDCSSAGAVDFLIGDWVSEFGPFITRESWITDGNSALAGAGEVRSVDTNEVRSTETLRIIEMGDSVFYVARPVQNKLPVAFELTECATGFAVFENAVHDFPKRIEYSADGKDRLTAHVSDGGERGFQIDFRRVGR